MAIHMGTKSQVIVVIPIHNSKPSHYELISFEQCFKILGSYEIVVVAPRNLNLNAYRRIHDFEVIYIDPIWQSSLLNYNRLKLSRFFYNLFDCYEFLLTYELDAFVFKDELNYWCNKGYDYIGAPWMEGFFDSSSTKFLGVGNSGFSLRNIPAVLGALHEFDYIDPLQFTKQTKRTLKEYIKHELRLFYHKPIKSYFTSSPTALYEDYIISQVIAKRIDNFSVAPVEEAIKFSFEVRPDYLYRLNGSNLPMGCHAWWKFNLTFWKPYIETFGYVL